VAARVRFLGNRGDVPHVVRHCDFVVLSTSTVECLPYAVLEAMAVQRPAVCTAIGGLPELVAEGVTGHLVPPHDADALARAMRRILESPDRGKKMGDAARHRLETHFNFHQMVEAAESDFETAARRAVPHLQGVAYE
jgi:glycosyltransferase involved in cell wall biosynthesis